MREAQIRDAVIVELACDSRVPEAAVGVTVEDRTVTLTGRVDSYAEKLAAQAAAHRARGVLDVANDIVVKIPHGFGHTDTDLARAVRCALEWDVEVPDQRIRSTVHDAWVRLEGSVDSLRERDDAERAVQRLAGVRGVENHLEVIPTVVGAEEVRGGIQAALARQAAREAQHLAVSVQDGVVTLSGTVHSWAEKRAVLGLVSHARGVRVVDDRIDIRG
jgi:osmotically-inducible protein OsmY